MKFQLNKQNKRSKITTLDLHTEGEPLRLITSGYPEIIGNSMLAKRRYVTAHLDHLRQALMYEPRGHADMYGALITEPVTDDGDFGVLFMHNEGYSSMCGHGIIAIVTAGVECGEIAVNDNKITTVRIDSPAGRITAYVQQIKTKFKAKLKISFECVPSFVEITSQTVSIAGLGEVAYDIAFGGAYYAFVDADSINLDCSPKNVDALIHFGRLIKQAVMQSYEIKHPEHDDLSFLYGTIFTSSKTTDKNSHSRHVCIFADGEVDRSPTGTGVSARIALLSHYGEVTLNKAITIESIISSSMTVSATSSLSYFGKKAVIPNVSGKAYITGEHQFLIDENDPLKYGFLFR